MILFQLPYWILFFIIPFSGFYLTKFGISPVYISFSIGFCFLLILIFLRPKIKLSIEIILCFILLLYFTISQIILFKPDISAFIGVIFSLVYFIVSYLILSKVDNKLIINMSEKMIFFSIPLLIYEAYYRITNPVLILGIAEKGKEDLFFYFYKVNSIMYQDSNFVGLYIISLFFFLLYLKQCTNKKYYLSIIILIILTLTTISRASILTLFLFSIFYIFKQEIFRFRLIILFILIILAPFIYSFLNNHKTIDSSFSTKFMIINNTITYLKNCTFRNFFLGVGLGNAFQVLDIGAHNFIVTYLVETGLIGLLLISIFWLYILLKTNYKVGIVMFPFLFDSMSLTSHSIPYLYVIFAIILTIESRRKIYAREFSFCYYSSL